MPNQVDLDKISRLLLEAAKLFPGKRLQLHMTTTQTFDTDEVKHFYLIQIERDNA